MIFFKTLPPLKKFNATGPFGRMSFTSYLVEMAVHNQIPSHLGQFMD